MSVLVADCPRCGAKEMTFDLIAQFPVGIQYDWQHWFEVFCICRACNRSTIFVLKQIRSGDDDEVKKGLANFKQAVNQIMMIDRYVSIRDVVSKKPPEYIPENIAAVFKEGSTCMTIGCFNAAGTMFRLCVDLSTRAMLPSEKEEAKGLNSKVRRDLGLRLPWLFENGILPDSLKELSSCIKDDGNDAAHEGNLKKEDAEDILDFTYELLERIYTEPKKLELAKERRGERHKTKS